MRKMIPALLGTVLAVSLSACTVKPMTEESVMVPVETEAEVASAADESDAAADATETGDDNTESDVVRAAAMAYFANFPEERHMMIVPDLFARMDEGEVMFILDIRSAEDYAAGHLKGSYNIPYGTDIADNLGKIPDDAPVYVIGYSGQTSSQTTALLNAAGKYASNVQSGWNNGVTQTEGHEAYIDTEAVVLSEKTYEVDAEIAAAITAYYEEAASNSYPALNFPVDDLLTLVEAGSEDYTILSVRQAEDYEQGHIAGAINIPFAKGMQEQFAEIPTDKPVVVYCYSGQTASQTSAILRLLGYESYNLNGGMGAEGGAGWLGAGYPVVTE